MKDETVEVKYSSLVQPSAFSLHPFFMPLFIYHAGVFNQKVKRFAIAQPVRDATFAPFLCQDAAHLLYRLFRAFSDRVDLRFNLVVRDVDLFFFSDALQQHRSSHIFFGLTLQFFARAVPVYLLSAWIDASSDHIANSSLHPIVGLMIDQTLRHFKLMPLDQLSH